MRFDELRANWDGLGRTDPYWAILAYPERLGGNWAGDEAEFFATGRRAVDAVVETLDRLVLRPAPLHRALDFGCGAGRLTQALTPYAEHVDGVDIAASMIELARGHNQFPNQVTYHLNEAPDLALFSDASFDLIVSIIVLQHIPNPLKRRYLAEFVRILQPGGVAVFTVPSHGDLSLEGIVRRAPNSWQNAYRRRKYGYKDVMEFHPLRRGKVESTIGTAGGEILHVEREYSAGGPFVSYLYVVGKPTQ